MPVEAAPTRKKRIDLSDTDPENDLELGGFSLDPKAVKKAKRRARPTISTTLHPDLLLRLDKFCDRKSLTRAAAIEMLIEKSGI